MDTDRRPDPDYGYRGLQVRERLELLGQLSAELLHDLADSLATLEARARVAAADARAGRPACGDLEVVADSSGELAAWVRDVVESWRGMRTSPEVTVDVESVVRRAVRRFLPGARPLEVRVVSTLPEGVEVRGRASLLFRAVTRLLVNAARMARTEVQVELALEDPRRMDEQADAVVRIDVEDDGAGLDPLRVATLFEPMAGGEAVLGLGAVAWTVEQLGGWVRHRPGEALGGACFEIRLPVAAAAAG
jgi:two-component system, LuxR family, sensor kinase FixL